MNGYRATKANLKRMGISLDAWLEMISSQDWACECGTVFLAGKGTGAYLSHDRARLLCKGCSLSADWARRRPGIEFKGRTWSMTPSERVKHFNATGTLDCATCGKAKTEPELFGLWRRDARRGLAHCRECRASAQRRDHLAKNFLITQEEYAKILDHQGGGCAICGSTPKKKNLSVDHCHKTGLIRGVLCNRCNKSIGAFRDSVEILQRCIDYLKSPSATAAIGARYGLKGRTSNKVATKKRLNPELFKLRAANDNAELDGKKKLG